MWWTAAFGAPAAVLGSLATASIPGKGHLQMIATAALVGLTAYRTSRQPARRRPASVPVGDHPRRTPRLWRSAAWWCYAVIGAGAGMLSGLLGVGGGILMVPAFQSWLRMGLKETIATSLACVGLLAIPGTITHTLKHHIDWAFALPLCVGVVPGAQIGAHLAVKAADRSLRRVTGIVLGTIAASSGSSESSADFVHFTESASQRARANTSSSIDGVSRPGERVLLARVVAAEHDDGRASSSAEATSRPCPNGGRGEGSPEPVARVAAHSASYAKPPNATITRKRESSCNSRTR